MVMTIPGGRNLRADRDDQSMNPRKAGAMNQTQQQSSARRGRTGGQRKSRGRSTPVPPKVRTSSVTPRRRTAERVVMKAIPDRTSAQPKWLRVQGVAEQGALGPLGQSFGALEDEPEVAAALITLSVLRRRAPAVLRPGMMRPVIAQHDRERSAFTASMTTDVHRPPVGGLGLGHARSRGLATP